MSAQSVEDLERAELRRHYDERREMLASSGWQTLVAELKAARDAYADLSNIGTIEALWFAKGRIDQLDYLIGLHASTDHAFDMLHKAGRV